MSKARKWLLLGIYVVAAAVLFTYYLFPSETVKSYIAYKLNAADPDLTVAIDRVKPSFPPGLKLNAVLLAHTGNELVEIKHLIVRPVYWALLGDEKTYRFKGALYGGSVKGQIRLGQAQTAKAIQVDARFQGLKTEQIKAIEKLSGRKIFGMLDGDIAVTRIGRSSLEATAKLALTDGKVELLMPVFTYESLTFKSVQADLAMADQTLEIKRCDIKGQPADGAFTGTIALRAPLSKSILNIEGLVKPKPVFLALLRKSLPASLVPQTGAGDDGIGLSFSGTLDRPVFALQ